MEGKDYSNDVLFLRLSHKRKHLYCFNIERRLGGGIKSLIINVSDIETLLKQGFGYAKVSIMRDDGSAEETKKIVKEDGQTSILGYEGSAEESGMITSGVNPKSFMGSETSAEASDEL